MTVRDVFIALDTDMDSPISSEMISRLFDDQQHVEESLRKMTTVFESARDAFLDQLGTLHLSDLVREEYLTTGYFDWAGKKERSANVTPRPAGGPPG